MNLNNIHIPTTLSETLSNENWKQAMNAEMEVLKKDKTWEFGRFADKKKVNRLQVGLYY